ncbi:CoA transferase [Amycolatopsis rhabdoformis]|uniref:CoA transferase n=1 Tax=Amycolatopsis rhabdoformis TaxID=1448059 RepID=A0ABZ1IES1_9PSEU|nr:CoA transferase [Amycolatopsis rhabdoformis]WSE32589.1 CoA transferase [Amycolatopsis rhabdoformis]
MNSPDEVALWATSGAMAITGLRDGTPLVSTGRPATAVAQALRQIADRTEARTGVRPELPGVTLLGERAALTGFGRNGPRSIGGPFRILRTADGHLGISLPRASDRESVPALIGAAVPGEPWDSLAAWAYATPTAEAVGRCRVLDLAASAILKPEGSRDAAPVPVRITPGAARARVPERPRVVDLSSLWAGPLCAHLLWLGGAEVIKVESTRRPDGARGGNKEFYDLLHHGHAAVAFDFHAPADVDRLRALIASADLVIEASRPRALQRLGIRAEDHVAAGVGWLSITARGRASDTVGFGDDVACDAGLLAWAGEQPVPAADALADPLTGVTAAAVATEALLSTTSALVEVSMMDTAAAAAAHPPDDHRVVGHAGSWLVETATGLHPVLAPVSRRGPGPAAAAGADNHRYAP